MLKSLSITLIEDSSLRVRHMTFKPKVAILILPRFSVATLGQPTNSSD